MSSLSDAKMSSRFFSTIETIYNVFSSIVLKNKKYIENLTKNSRRNCLVDINSTTSRNDYENKDVNFIDSIFELETAPNINFIDYLKRIIYYSKINYSTLIISFILIDRFLNSKNYFLKSKNVYFVMAAGIIIASKFNDDKILSDKDYSTVFMISSSRLHILESLFLKDINYDIFVNNKCYNEYINLLK